MIYREMSDKESFIKNTVDQKPLLTDEVVFDIQDYIEHQCFSYSEEEIENEDFARLVSNGWTREFEYKESNTRYTFKLQHSGENIVEVFLTVKPINDELRVVDIEINELR